MFPSMTDNLRVNASAKVLSRSPAHEKARVIETKELEVRTIAKVRSITDRRTYWIASSSVKKPVNMTLEEFIEKFNEGSTFGSERISKEDFSLSENKAVRVNAKNYISLTLDEFSHNITNVDVMILSSSMTEGIVHPWIQQTMNVFYPVSIISSTEFYQDIVKYKICSFALGKTRRFPIDFLMAYSADFVMLSMEFNNNSEKAKNSSPESSALGTDKHSTHISKNKKNKSQQEADYVKEIHSAVKEMLKTGEDLSTQTYIYMPQIYSQYMSDFDFRPYVVHNRKEGIAALYVLIGMQNPEWIFAKAIAISCDGKNFFITDLTEKQKEILWGNGIYESYDEWLLLHSETVNKSRAALLAESIMSAKNVLISFVGDERTATRTLSKEDFLNLAKCMTCYKKLSAIEDEWNK